ncbi:hypothetical protein F3Y22_tig00003041pilonHSYRG00724 [Hibiscus syriacus]|uniref:Endonuclease/exonuclease/phosphatase domain-containing protein n=1 Tax=Hibiscus syriacus TaxID=106335 RepID=A0A6A3CKZ9_HIBSY|nr:hypothetical protein F3Y22_tig00003041pilonHSYRG00724 [Hibiscus syriacus]
MVVVGNKDDSGWKASKRQLQGKYEVTHPINSKRSKVSLSSDGGVGTVGKLKNISAEAAGQSRRANRKLETWDLLDRLVQSSSLPWVIGGDFNDVLTDTEKSDGRRKYRLHHDEFRNALDRNGLTDCRPSLGWFTGNRNSQTIDESIIDKIDSIGSTLKDWQTDRLSNVRARITYLQKVVNKGRTILASTVEGAMTFEGDRSTGFFHARSTQRRKKNRLKGLFNKDEMWSEDKKTIQDTAVSYFLELFTFSNPGNATSILEAIEEVVTTAMNSHLCRPFTAEKVLTAFHGIHPNKAPGYDGLSTSFFRHHWGRQISDNILVAQELLHYLNSSKNDINKGATLKLDIEKAYDCVE